MQVKATKNIASFILIVGISEELLTPQMPQVSPFIASRIHVTQCDIQFHLVFVSVDPH